MPFLLPSPSSDLRVPEYLSSMCRRVIVSVDEETAEVGCSFIGLITKCHPVLSGMGGDTFGVGPLNLFVLYCHRT